MPEEKKGNGFGKRKKGVGEGRERREAAPSAVSLPTCSCPCGGPSQVAVHHGPTHGSREMSAYLLVPKMTRSKVTHESEKDKF